MGKQVPVTAQRTVAVSPDDGALIDLRDPAVAALLSWLVPGLGQVYQGRRFKGWLFMAVIVCVMVVGLWIGGGKVAYCLWRPGARRLEFVGQAGVGAVAIPALVQSWSLAAAGRPLIAGGWFAPPVLKGQPVAAAYAGWLERVEPGISFARDQRDGTLRSRTDQLSLWYLRLGRFFDLGTLYTTIAGLLNLLVVYDAWAGPLREAEPATEDSAAGTARDRRKAASP